MTNSEIYTVSDGNLVLTLESAEEGGHIVTSPLDPELITQAETLPEAFANARDAANALRVSRKKSLSNNCPSPCHKSSRPCIERTWNVIFAIKAACIIMARITMFG